MNCKNLYDIFSVIVIFTFLHWNWCFAALEINKISNMCRLMVLSVVLQSNSSIKVLSFSASSLLVAEAFSCKSRVWWGALRMQFVLDLGAEMPYTCMTRIYNGALAHANQFRFVINLSQGNWKNETIIHISEISSSIKKFWEWQQLLGRIKFN